MFALGKIAGAWYIFLAKPSSKVGIDQIRCKSLGIPETCRGGGRRSPILLLCSVQKPRTGLLHHIQTLEEKNALLEDENASLLGRLLCSFGHGLKTVSKSKLEVKAPKLFGSMVQQFLPPFS